MSMTSLPITLEVYTRTPVLAQALENYGFTESAARHGPITALHATTPACPYRAQSK